MRDAVHVDVGVAEEVENSAAAVEELLSLGEVLAPGCIAG